MKCLNCGAAMIRRSKYRWNGGKQKLVVTYYYQCPECGRCVDNCVHTIGPNTGR